MIRSTELIKLGLTQKEADVYLALLELGSSDAPLLAKRTGVNRTTTYVILDALAQKGLVSTFEKKGKRWFVSESPSFLEKLISLREEQVEGMKQHFDGLLPQLLGIFNLQKNKPVVRYYEGEEAVSNLRKHILHMQGGELLGITPLTLPEQCSQEEIEKMCALRKNISDRGIAIRGIFCCGSEEKGKLNDSKYEKFFDHMQARCIPKEKFGFNSEINIFDDKLVIADIKDGVPLGVMIAEPNMVSSFTSFFELAWENASNYDILQKK